MDPLNTRRLRVDGLEFTALEGGSGPLVLCLHGFPDHRRTWRALLPDLARSGFRAVAPNLRGYEPSSRPADGDYQVARLVEDVIGWLDQLEVERAHLVGHDWGAVIGYETAARAPERILSLTALGSIRMKYLPRGIRRHPSQLLRSSYMLFFQLRGIPEYLLARNDFAALERMWQAGSPSWRCPPDELARVKETMRQPGVLSAALGYYRALRKVATRSGAETRALERRPVGAPTRILAGPQDSANDIRLFQEILDPADFPAGLEVERVDGTGHWLHLEQPVRVNARIIDWVSRHSPRTF